MLNEELVDELLEHRALLRNALDSIAVEAVKPEVTPHRILVLAERVLRQTEIIKYYRKAYKDLDDSEGTTC